MRTITKNECRVYIACLAAYNAGILHGKWVDVDGLTVDELQSEINAVLAASPEEGAEEWAIHDHEGFHGLIKGEWPNLEDVCKWAELIAEHGEAIALYGAYNGIDTDELESRFLDSYRGEWDSFQDYVEQTCDDIGYLENVPDHIKYHIDWESVAREWSYDHFEEKAAGGGVHVFDANS